MGFIRMQDLYNNDFFYFITFLQEMRICMGANNSAETISRTDLLITPLKRNTTEGMIERAKARNMLFFFQSTVQRSQ